jgi:LacI family transcriptional regulator
MKEKQFKSRNTTIYDIAAEVGTSAATVSRVLSDSGYPVSEKLKQRVLDVSQKLRYSPNIVGRMLKKSASMDIGVIIPTISNPFYPNMILGIESEARERGYNILLCNSFRNPDAEKKYVQLLYQKQVRGIIISSIDENHMFLKEMQQNGVIVVVFDQDIDELKCSRVGFDYVKGGVMAVEYLAKLGHRRIAFLSSPLTRKSRRETHEGYRLGLLENGLQYDRDLVLISDYEEESREGTYEFENGKNLAMRFMDILQKERPTGIFAVNDMTAFGIMQHLLGKGMDIPGDISVIGFDNIEMSSMINPPLTTVNQPSFQTGKLAGKLLLDSLEGKERGEVSITLEPSLVVRKSVKQIFHK